MLSMAVTPQPLLTLARRALVVASAARDSTRPVVALDFDGVICDSEPELTRSAWRTAVELWPDRMSAAAELDPQSAGARRAWVGGDWEGLQGLSDDEEGLPIWLAEKMRQIRPCIETGYESVLLMRLCVDEAVASSSGKSGSRPLTPGEITTNFNPEMRDVLLARYGLRAEEAIQRYSDVRDAWIADDEEGWLSANGFYGGAVDAVRKAVSDGEHELYIVTTKQARFAQALLQSQGIQLADERIFGLGSGPKAKTLSTLAQRHEGSCVSFVEDKVETLRAVANDVSLFSTALYFAEWGYSTAEQQALASSMPRVKSLSTSESLSAVFQSASGEA